jgi:chromosome segregation ATPase
MMNLTPAVPPGAAIDGSDKHPPGFARINDLAIDAGALEALLPELGGFSDEIKDLARNAAKMKAEVDGKVAELRDFQWSIHAVRVEVEQGQAALAKARNLLAEEIAQSTAALEARQADLTSRARAVEDRTEEWKRRSTEIAGLRDAFERARDQLEADQKRHAGEQKEFGPKADLLARQLAALKAINSLTTEAV